MTFLEGLQERYKSAKSSYDRFIKDNEYVAAAIGLATTITGISIIKKLFFSDTRVDESRGDTIPVPPGSDVGRPGGPVGGRTKPSVDPAYGPGNADPDNNGSKQYTIGRAPGVFTIALSASGFSGEKVLEMRPGDLDMFLNTVADSQQSPKQPLLPRNHILDSEYSVLRNPGVLDWLEQQKREYLGYTQSGLDGDNPVLSYPEEKEQGGNVSEEDVDEQDVGQEPDISGQGIQPKESEQHAKIRRYYSEDDDSVAEAAPPPASPQTTPVPVVVKPSSPVIEEVDGQGAVDSAGTDSASSSQGAQSKEAGQYEQVIRHYSEDDDSADSVAEAAPPPASPQTTAVPVAVEPSSPVIEEVDGQGAVDSAGTDSAPPAQKEQSEEDGDEQDVAQGAVVAKEDQAEPHEETAVVPVAGAPSSPDSPVAEAAPTTVPQAPNAPAASGWSWGAIAGMAGGALLAAGTIALAVAQANREERKESAQGVGRAPASEAKPTAKSTAKPKSLEEELEAQYKKQQAIQEHRKKIKKEGHDHTGPKFNYTKHTKQKPDGTYEMQPDEMQLVGDHKHHVEGE